MSFLPFRAVPALLIIFHPLQRRTPPSHFSLYLGGNPPDAFGQTVEAVCYCVLDVIANCDKKVVAFAPGS